MQTKYESINFLFSLIQIIAAIGIPILVIRAVVTMAHFLHEGELVEGVKKVKSKLVAAVILLLLGSIITLIKNYYVLSL